MCRSPLSLSSLWCLGQQHSKNNSYNSINGVPACGNAELLTYVLRDQWGFEGFVVSDYDAMAFIYTTHLYVDSFEEAVAVALKAGCDQEGGGESFITIITCTPALTSLLWFGTREICLPHRHFRGYSTIWCTFTTPNLKINTGTVAIDRIPKTIEDGLLTLDYVNIAFARLFRIRIMLGQFDPPTMVKYNYYGNDSSVEGNAHMEYSREVAAKSVCLYKNANNVLPLYIDNIKSLVVIGPQGIGTNLLLGNYGLSVFSVLKTNEWWMCNWSMINRGYFVE